MLSLLASSRSSQIRSDVRRELGRRQPAGRLVERVDLGKRIELARRRAPARGRIRGSSRASRSAAPVVAQRGRTRLWSTRATTPSSRRRCAAGPGSRDDGLGILEPTAADEDRQPAEQRLLMRPSSRLVAPGDGAAQGALTIGAIGAPSICSRSRLCSSRPSSAPGGSSLTRDAASSMRQRQAVETLRRCRLMVRGVRRASALKSGRNGSGRCTNRATDFGRSAPVDASSVAAATSAGERRDRQLLLAGYVQGGAAGHDDRDRRSVPISSAATSRAASSDLLEVVQHEQHVAGRPVDRPACRRRSAGLLAVAERLADGRCNERPGRRSRPAG